MSRRGLGEVFHYFIPEEEQASARDRAASRTPPAPASSRRPTWCLALDPERPLECALGVEIAAALAEPGRCARVLASFAAHPLLPRSDAVAWQRVEGDAAALAAALDGGSEDGRLVALPPGQLLDVLPGLPRDAIYGVILPVDGAAWGMLRALALLRHLRALRELRMGVVVVGAPSKTEARRLYGQLAGAAMRQLGRRLEMLGSLQRDPASYRSLLAGTSVLDTDRSAGSARDLAAVGERLARRGTRAEAEAPGAP